MSSRVKIVITVNGEEVTVPQPTPTPNLNAMVASLESVGSSEKPDVTKPDLGQGVVVSLNDAGKLQFRPIPSYPKSGMPFVFYNETNVARTLSLWLKPFDNECRLQLPPNSGLKFVVAAGLTALSEWDYTIDDEGGNGPKMIVDGP